ncbi:hypothetical protein K490DRAFT_57110 [Saccharata proteae CBS 121410]|uniref:Uncharacterized protein n=1 Tax=Saccharata proteae CBS 121410 TaxID=1314787 RepID=A0A9P4LV08_9PEZI|nr:hypothetical protein K490DRAFT_57110 [Saccharata proteae CBS 121410]
MEKELPRYDGSTIEISEGTEREELQKGCDILVSEMTPGSVNLTVFSPSYLFWQYQHLSKRSSNTDNRSNMDSGSTMPTSSRDTATDSNGATTCNGSIVTDSSTATATDGTTLVTTSHARRRRILQCCDGDAYRPNSTNGMDSSTATATTATDGSTSTPTASTYTTTPASNGSIARFRKAEKIMNDVLGGEASPNGPNSVDSTTIAIDGTATITSTSNGITTPSSNGITTFKDSDGNNHTACPSSGLSKGAYKGGCALEAFELINM